MYLVDRLLEIEDADPEFIDLFQLKQSDYQSFFTERVAVAVRCGNQKMAAHLIKKMYENQGYGYN